jgi:hypothetical protein
MKEFISVSGLAPSNIQLADCFSEHANGERTSTHISQKQVQGFPKALLRKWGAGTRQHSSNTPEMNSKRQRHKTQMENIFHRQK